MINTIVELNQIHYKTVPCEKLLDSIRKRGVAIAVQVNQQEDGYECVDGNQRCSACAILCKEDPKFARIPIMILNNYTKAGSGFWGNTQNHH